LYTRTGQMAQAAQCCAALRDVYAAAGHKKEAAEYGELATRYGEQAAASAEPEKTQPAAFVEAAEQPAPPVQEPPATAPAAPEFPSAVAASESPAALSDEDEEDAEAHEIDLSEEWDRVLKAEQLPEFAMPPVSSDFPAAGQDSATSGNEDGADDSDWEIPDVPASASPWDAPAAMPTSPATAAAAGDLVEEARFYISQSMWHEAESAISRAEAMVPGAPAIVELKTELAARREEPSAPPVAAPSRTKTGSLLTFPSPAPAAPPAQSATLPSAVGAMEQQAVSARRSVSHREQRLDEDLADAMLPAVESSTGSLHSDAASSLPAFPDAVVAAPESQASIAPQTGTGEDAGMLDSFVASLEQALGIDFAVESPRSKPAAKKEPPRAAPEPEAPAETAVKTDNSNPSTSDTDYVLYTVIALASICGLFAVKKNKYINNI
jgi:hypothetical protein